MKKKLNVFHTALRKIGSRVMNFSRNEIELQDLQQISRCPRQGASCSKLTMSLVNDSLKIQMAILQTHRYFFFFFFKKCENPHIVSTKITEYLLLKSITN